MTELKSLSELYSEGGVPTLLEFAMIRCYLSTVAQNVHIKHQL